ncbi:hypothetical protein ABPG77_009279 [Micractinium sp. CCAP 211/92]
MVLVLQQRAAVAAGLRQQPAQRRPRFVVTAAAASRSLPGHSSMGTWARLQLARRKLDLAVREENYAAAAQAQREVALLTERLPPSKALLNTLLQRLDAATHAACALPEEEEAANAEKLAVLERLGELADWDGAAAMAAALHDGDAAVAAAAEDALWALFMECPTPELQTQMRQGVSLMRRPEQWDQALALFDSMVRAAPTFAEAYNKRGTVLYLMQRYHEAIADARVTLEMNPYHFACASGMGLCCAAVGDNAGALAAYQQAVAINPRMSALRQHIMQLRELLTEEQRQLDHE